MTNQSLSASYFKKARARLKVLAVLMDEKDYSDVVREARKIVELSLKALLRLAGVEPPKWHDVGELVLEHRQRFSDEVKEGVEKLAAISARLRKEREMAFYGDVDFIPSEEYSKEDARQAIDDAVFVFSLTAGER
jgi:HEPN domain-containing protein